MASQEVFNGEETYGPEHIARVHAALKTRLFPSTKEFLKSLDHKIQEAQKRIEYRIANGDDDDEDDGLTQDDLRKLLVILSFLFDIDFLLDYFNIIDLFTFPEYKYIEYFTDTDQIRQDYIESVPEKMERILGLITFDILELVSSEELSAALQDHIQNKMEFFFHHNYEKCFVFDFENEKWEGKNFVDDGQTQIKMLCCVLLEIAEGV